MQSRMPFRQGSEWLSWGRFLNKGGDREFDIERIKHELEKNLYRYRFCPALDLDHIGRVIEAFPRQVKPRRDRDWQMQQDWRGSSGGLTFVVNEFGLKREVTYKGVSPVGQGAARKILSALKVTLPIPG